MSKTLSFTNATNTTTVVINQTPGGDKSYEVKTTNYADVPVNVAKIHIPDFDENLLLALHDIIGETKKPTNMFPEVIRHWVFKWFTATKTVTLQHLVNTPKQWHNNPGWILTGESASESRTFYFWMSSTKPNTVPDVQHLSLEIPWKYSPPTSIVDARIDTTTDLMHFKAFYKGIEYVKVTTDGGQLLKVTTFDKDKNFLFQWRVPKKKYTHLKLHVPDSIVDRDEFTSVHPNLMHFKEHDNAIEYVKAVSSERDDHIRVMTFDGDKNLLFHWPVPKEKEDPLLLLRLYEIHGEKEIPRDEIHASIRERRDFGDTHTIRLQMMSGFTCIAQLTPTQQTTRCSFTVFGLKKDKSPTFQLSTNECVTHSPIRHTDMDFSHFRLNEKLDHHAYAALRMYHPAIRFFEVTPSLEGKRISTYDGDDELLLTWFIPDELHKLYRTWGTQEIPFSEIPKVIRSMKDFGFTSRVRLEKDSEGKIVVRGYNKDGTSSFVYPRVRLEMDPDGKIVVRGYPKPKPTIQDMFVKKIPLLSDVPVTRADVLKLMMDYGTKRIPLKDGPDALKQWCGLHFPRVDFFSVLIEGDTWKLKGFFSQDAAFTLEGDV